MDTTRTQPEKVKNVEAFARDWCERYSPGPDATEDIVQEAHLAAIEFDGDMDEITKAMNRYRMREYRQPRPFSSLGEDANIDDVAEGGLRDDDLGLSYQSYHGDCCDDV